MWNITTNCKDINMDTIIWGKCERYCVAVEQKLPVIVVVLNYSWLSVKLVEGCQDFCENTVYMYFTCLFFPVRAWLTCLKLLFVRVVQFPTYSVFTCWSRLTRWSYPTSSSCVRSTGVLRSSTRLTDWRIATANCCRDCRVLMWFVPLLCMVCSILHCCVVQEHCLR